MTTHKNGIELTPKQMAVKIFKSDLELVTGYWQDRYADRYGEKKLTDSDCMKIQLQLDKLEKRIWGMLEKAAKV